MATRWTTWWMAAVCGLTTACASDGGQGGTPDAGEIFGDPADAAPDDDPAGCGPATCDGCCDGDACMSGTSPSACGGGGEACAVCEPGFVCQEAACTVDRTSRWDVLVDSASVFEDNAGGGAWDPQGGLPDTYVRMQFNDGVDDHDESSSSTDDTLTPSWNQVLLADVPAGAVLDNGIRTTLLDDDPLLDESDSMGTCRIAFDDADFSGDILTVECPFDREAGARGWTLRLSLVRK